MSRTQYIYCWFDQRYQAIKVGHSFRPGVRLLNYMVACNLDPAPDTLRMVSLEDWRNAQEIERRCHELLRSIGLRNVPHSNPRGGDLKDLFCLNGYTYSAIAELVINYAERCEDWLITAQFEAWQTEQERAEQERAEQEARTHWALGIGVAGYTWPLEWGDAP